MIKLFLQFPFKLSFLSFICFIGSLVYSDYCERLMRVGINWSRSTAYVEQRAFSSAITGIAFCVLLFIILLEVLVLLKRDNKTNKPGCYGTPYTPVTYAENDCCHCDYNDICQCGKGEN